MKNIFIIFTILTFLTSAAQSEEIDGFTLDFKTGYRFDQFDWNIAGGPINIISELQWEDVESHVSTAEIKFPLFKFKKNSQNHSIIYLSGGGSYSSVFGGLSQDSDYNESNRGGEFSRSNSKISKSSLEDYYVQLNYQIPINYPINTTFITPYVGYSINKQNFIDEKGTQSLCVSPCSGSLGEFSEQGINSTYDSQWDGFFFGLSFAFSPLTNHYLNFSASYHFIEYYAEADWILRTDFEHPKSFEHVTDGEGQILDVTYKYRINKNMSAGINLNYKNFSTDSGIVRFFPISGQSSTQILNEVNWNSFSSSLLFSFSF